MQLSSYGLSRQNEGFSRNSHARERDSELVGNGARVGALGQTTWGGARNRRDRVTNALRLQQSEDMLKAMAIAELRAMPLTRHWIVDYENAGIDDKDGAAFIGRLLSQCRRYAKRHGGTFAAVWVREVGGRNGAHAHIAFHWPRGWKLGYLTRRWIKAAGGTYRKKVSRVVPIGGSINCAWTSPDLYHVNLENLANYLVKGSDRNGAQELGLELLKSGGRIIGKRSGRTQNLG